MSMEHLKRKLDGLKGKITFYSFLYGTGIFLAFFAGAFLVLFALDQIPESFNVGLQGVLWRLRVMILGVFALMIFVFRRYLTRPLGEHWSHDDLALLVEKEYKELNDSLISTVQFERGNLPTHFNSPQLVKATIEKTVRETKSMNFTRGVRHSMAVLAFVLAFVCLGANSASAVVFDEAYPLFMQRVWAAITFGPLPMKPQHTYLDVSVRVKEKDSRLEHEVIPVREKNNLCVIPVPRGDAIVIKAVIDKRRSIIFPDKAFMVRSTNNGKDYNQEAPMTFHSGAEYDFAEESQAYIRGCEDRLKIIAAQFSGREKNAPPRYRDEKAELERNLAIMSVDLNKITSPDALKFLEKYNDKNKIVASLKSLKDDIVKKRGECRTVVDAMNAAATSHDKVRATVNAYMDYRRTLEILRNELEEEAGNVDVLKQKKFKELVNIEGVFKNALLSLRLKLETRDSKWNELRRTLDVLPIRNSQKEHNDILPQERHVFFSDQLSDVTSGFKFYISCGDSLKANINRDLSQHYEVRVIERPATINMNVYVVRPEYADASQRSVRLEEGSDLTALPGTRVQVSTRINKSKDEIKTAALMYTDSVGNVINSNSDGNAMNWVEYYVVEEDGEEYFFKKENTPGTAETARKNSRTEQWLEGEFTVTQSGHYWVALTDTHNYTNNEHKVYEVVALKDKYPTMEINYPDQHRLVLTPNAVLPFRMVARDDNNIRELVVKYKFDTDKSVYTFPLVPELGTKVDSRGNSKVMVLAPPDITSHSAQDVLSHSAVVIVGDIYKDGSQLNIPGWKMQSVGIAPDAENYRHLKSKDKIKFWIECSDYYNGKDSHTIKSKEFMIEIADEIGVRLIVEEKLLDLLKQSTNVKNDGGENIAKMALIMSSIAGEGMADAGEVIATDANKRSSKGEDEVKAEEESVRQNIRAKIECVRIQANNSARLAEKLATDINRLSKYIEINRLPNMGEIPNILEFCATDLGNISEQYNEEVVTRLKKASIFDEDQKNNLDGAMETQQTIASSLYNIEEKIQQVIGMIVVTTHAEKVGVKIIEVNDLIKDARGKMGEVLKGAPKPEEPVRKP